MKISHTIPEGVVVRQFGLETQEIPENTETDQIDQRRLLVLLNGIGAGVDNWGQFAAALNRPCKAIDVSKAVSCNRWPKMVDYSHAVMKTLDSFGHDKVDVLGLSWGGALAQEVAIRHGNRIGNLALVATLPGRTSFPPEIQAIMALNSPDRSQATFQLIAGSVYGGDIRTQPDLLNNIGNNRIIDPKAYQRQKLALITWNSSVLRLTNIDVPTLVIAGEDDPIARPINARMIAAVIKNSELHIVPAIEGGGHLLLHTRPHESAVVINRFLDKNQTD